MCFDYPGGEGVRTGALPPSPRSERLLPDLLSPSLTAERGQLGNLRLLCLSLL